MLTDIRLDERQLALLEQAAGRAGAELDPDYLGEFRPADSPRCVVLRCSSPGQLILFAASVAFEDYPLAGLLASRISEDRSAGAWAYYWPGVLAP